jgi:hypothetical protein
MEKVFLLVILQLILRVTSLSAQDTVYFDLINQTAVSETQATNPNLYTLDSTRTDTVFNYNSGIQDIWYINTSYTETIPSVYSRYIGAFSITDAQGGYTFTVDTNSTNLHTGTIQNLSQPLKDTVALKPNARLSFNIFNISNNGKYLAEVDVFHVVDTFFVRNKTVSVDDIAKNEEVTLTLYPSPTTQYLSLREQEFLNQEYRILNLQGQLLQSGQSKKQIDVANLPPGVYFLNLPEMGVTKKFVKQQ